MKSGLGDRNNIPRHGVQFEAGHAVSMKSGLGDRNNAGNDEMVVTNPGGSQ